MDSQLTPLQQDILQAFFKQEGRFFLTGGGALAGFYLGHRPTYDLDLFTTVDAMAEGSAALFRAAEELAATVESLQTSPDFRRYLVRRESEGVVVDLARDRAPQLMEHKAVVNGIRIDPVDEIFVNKICALLSRSELRDLVDLKALEEHAGLRLELFLSKAAQKDAGLTPAQLAWVLSQLQIGPDAIVPGGGGIEQLRTYLRLLLERLAKMAFPG